MCPIRKKGTLRNGRKIMRRDFVLMFWVSVYVETFRVKWMEEYRIVEDLIPKDTLPCSRVEHSLDAAAAP